MRMVLSYVTLIVLFMIMIVLCCWCWSCWVRFSSAFTPLASSTKTPKTTTTTKPYQSIFVHFINYSPSDWMWSMCKMPLRKKPKKHQSSNAHFPQATASTALGGHCDFIRRTRINGCVPLFLLLFLLLWVLCCWIANKNRNETDVNKQSYLIDNSLPVRINT